MLICDDDEGVLISLKEMLENILSQQIDKKDIHILTFKTTYDMMDYLEEKSASVDAVVLDIELNDEGGANGIDLAVKIEKEYGYIKIIFCTGYIKRSKRKNVDRDTSKSTPFIVTIKSDNRTGRYRLFAYDKSDMLAFVLFLESYFNNVNVLDFTSADIEMMYHSSNFGLKMLYSI